MFIIRAYTGCIICPGQLTPECPISFPATLSSDLPRFHSVASGGTAFSDWRPVSLRTCGTSLAHLSLFCRLARCSRSRIESSLRREDVGVSIGHWAIAPLGRQLFMAIRVLSKPNTPQARPMQTWKVSNLWWLLYLVGALLSGACLG